jgi:hypothetical protein
MNKEPYASTFWEDDIPFLSQVWECRGSDLDFSRILTHLHSAVDLYSPPISTVGDRKTAALCHLWSGLGTYFLQNVREKRR